MGNRREGETRETLDERPSLGELLGHYTEILGSHGAASPEARAFLEEHKDNRRFIELARVARSVKEALAPAECP